MFGIRKQSKVEAEWQAWLAKRKGLKATMERLAIREARSRYTSAQEMARQLGMDAKDLMGERRDLQRSPTNEDLQKIATALSRYVKDCLERGRTDLAFSPEQMLAELEEANEAAGAALEHLKSLEDQQETLENDLQHLKNNPPDADLKALTVLDKELAQLESDKARIREALDSMMNDDGGIRQAEQEAADAQYRLDSMEASAVLGQSNESEQRSAAAMLAKATARATKAKEEAERRSSARRGLESKLDNVNAQAEALSDLRSELALTVYKEEMRESENRLIAFLEAEEVKGLTNKLYESRRGYEKALAERQGRTPRAGKPVTVLLPEIKYHHYNTAGNVHGVDVTLKI